MDQSTFMGMFIACSVILISLIITIIKPIINLNTSITKITILVDNLVAKQAEDKCHFDKFGTEVTYLKDKTNDHEFRIKNIEKKHEKEEE